LAENFLKITTMEIGLLFRNEAFPFEAHASLDKSFGINDTTITLSE
jgi:hypothetical protein